ncbi:ABC transporter permease [Pedobacter insulae]|uniref:ABC-2 family transporter protein n=1 Tax=Pedobacter insulae TaxID=414048 RepID=A0A1I2WR50_9SPHI|nr:ABC transporter permease [Pedobacter insulae]SFH03814.1 hypothetical protein SAMN04489864_104232 [Pedobacter insulae]
MNLMISLKSEFLKTKRSPIWLFTIAMALIVPIFVLIIFKEEHDGVPSDQIKVFSKDAWNFYFYQGRGMISIVFLPMFIVLISALLPQIEYRNHTWKQVFASPQSYWKIYFSKFLIFNAFMICFFIAHGLFMGVSGMFSGMLNPKFNFAGNQVDWSQYLMKMSQAYLAILPLATLQFWLGLRFKSFLIPIGVGVLFSILGMINMIGYKLIDPDKFFFNYAAFIFFKENVARIPYVLWASTAYAVAFLLIGFLDFSRIRER